MKLLAFYLVAVAIGSSIAYYNLLPKKDKKEIVNRKSKIFVAIVLATVIVLFSVAMSFSLFTVKIF